MLSVLSLVDVEVVVPIAAVILTEQCDAVAMSCQVLMLVTSALGGDVDIDVYGDSELEGVYVLLSSAEHAPCYNVTPFEFALL